MIRILHVIDSLDLGGAQTALLNLIKPCDKSRFHHEVASMHGRGMYACAFEALGVPVHQLSARRWPPGYLWELPALLRRGDFDIVHCHLFGSNWIAKPIAFLSGCRCLYNHDQCNDAFRSESALVTWIDRMMNHFSTRILAVSHSVADFLATAESISPNRITYLPNSVDIVEFRPASADEQRIARKNFNLPAAGVVVGGVGRLTGQKQFDVFVTAANALCSRHPDWTFVLFGSGPEEDRLRSLASGLGDAFRFAGTVEARETIYHALDVQVLPSRFEGMPMTMLEGMASGLPVVASRVDGVCEIATDGENALLVTPGDPAALANAIEQAAQTGTNLARLRAAAREHVAREFNAQILSGKLHALYGADIKVLI